MDKMSRCKECENLDKERSNENWVVCPIIPLDVILAQSSKKCANYKRIE